MKEKELRDLIDSLRPLKRNLWENGLGVVCFSFLRCFHSSSWKKPARSFIGGAWFWACRGLCALRAFWEHCGSGDRSIRVWQRLTASLIRMGGSTNSGSSWRRTYSERVDRIREAVALVNTPNTALTQQLLHHVPMDVGEAKVAALETVGQAFVIKAKQVQEGRVQIVNIDWILLHIPAHLVGFANDLTTLDAAAGKPFGEGVGMMVSAGDGLEIDAVFAEWRAPEFTAPDDDRVIEQPAGLQVF
jgi:hypothetical protein